MPGLYNKSKTAIMKWRDKNKQQYLEYMNQYNQTNKDTINEKMRTYYHDKGKEKKREYYLKKKAEREAQKIEPI
jgi:hypothetical protein